jgi:hypothetical protein
MKNNIDLSEFKQWLIAREYSKSYIYVNMSYINRYSYILQSNCLRDLDVLTNHKKAGAVKALILYSSFSAMQHSSGRGWKNMA